MGKGYGIFPFSIPLFPQVRRREQLRRTFTHRCSPATTTQHLINHSAPPPLPRWRSFVTERAFLRSMTRLHCVLLPSVVPICHGEERRGALFSCPEVSLDSPLPPYIRSGHTQFAAPIFSSYGAVVRTSIRPLQHISSDYWRTRRSKRRPGGRL